MELWQHDEVTFYSFHSVYAFSGDYLEGSMFDPHSGHLVSRHGTPLVWGTLVLQFGQTHSSGPPMPCLLPPLPRPYPLPLKICTRRSTTKRSDKWFVLKSKASIFCVFLFVPTPEACQLPHVEFFAPILYLNEPIFLDESFDGGPVRARLVQQRINPSLPHGMH